MRTMLTFRIPVEKGNAARADGTLAQTLEELMSVLDPEAAYFWPQDGERGGMFVFNMRDPSEIPKIAEKLFVNLNAAVKFNPVMNVEDLKRGLEASSG